MTLLFQDASQFPKQKPVSLLPLLTVLFIISYAMLTYLVVQQATTISAQRTLIRQLFGDSIELSAMKGKALQAQSQAKTQTQTQPQDAAPKSKAAPAPKAQPEASRPQRLVPEKPSKNTGVLLDTRRVMTTL